MLTELTRLTKENQKKVSVNRAHSVNEGKSERSVLTELTWLTKESRRKVQFSPSSLGHRRKDGEIGFHRVHSVITGNAVFTEFTRLLKNLTEFSILTELSRLTQELPFVLYLPS